MLKSHLRPHETENYDVEVIDEFKGMGVTILFDDTQEAVVGGLMNLPRKTLLVAMLTWIFL